METEAQETIDFESKSICKTEQYSSDVHHPLEVKSPAAVTRLRLR
jgi:hypothetical protein